MTQNAIALNTLNFINSVVFVETAKNKREILLHLREIKVKTPRETFKHYTLTSLKRVDIRLQNNIH